ncbi:hypothetical protein ASG90_17705 [Nocardioides sp. Soil797]|nr:hypothetical protein ASG90_17705 [Nocardioides sp. Soil797]
MKILTHLATGAAAVACLSLASPGISQAATARPTSTSPTTTAAVTSATTTPACANRDLLVSFRYQDAGAGSAYGRIRIKNVSGHPCHTGGYGGVSYVGNGDGTQIGHAAIRESGTVRSFVLKPGNHLVSELRMQNREVYSRSECRPKKVDGFRIYVPNAVKSQFVAYRTSGCRVKKVHLLHQQPYRRP